MDYKEVNVLEYVKNGIQSGALSFNEAKKFQRISARQGEVGEKVKTILSDGTEETEEREVILDEKTNEPGWIVKNINGPEQWIVDDSIFKKKYEADPEQEGVFKPKGGPMLAAQISENLQITPPKWGGDIQKINAGGYLLMDPTDPSDVYGIGEEEFNNTYKFTEEQKQKSLNLNQD
ncbi:MAG: hypothetical protein VZS44_03155 [Bacilli bacterium]|nr:hypothetical protein [Bacilli bacterium]